MTKMIKKKTRKIIIIILTIIRNNQYRTRNCIYDDE